MVYFAFILKLKFSIPGDNPNLLDIFNVLGAWEVYEGSLDFIIIIFFMETELNILLYLKYISVQGNLLVLFNLIFYPKILVNFYM